MDVGTITRSVRRGENLPDFTFAITCDLQEILGQPDGFLLGPTPILRGWTANCDAETITQRSLAPVLVAAPAIVLGVVVRAVISVPVLGGGVALLRWIGRLVRPPQRPAARAPRA